MKNIDEKRCYPEDYKLENGMYVCKCSDCGEAFQGHKRRVICKLCSNKRLAESRPAPRYELRLGKFGHYFYDTKYKTDLGLQAVLELLNDEK
jgi:DNA-directed RNA polymerase subunit RPC12/RpoP